MVNFQSMLGEYRETDSNASGIPILISDTLLCMGKKERSEFGGRLFKARTDAKLTQKELAAKVQMAQSTLNELEWSGQGSSKTTQLAEVCGVSAGWLATGSANEVTAAWPFVGIITPGEWRALDADVKDDVLAAVEHYISRYRQKAGADESGKSSGYQHGVSQRAA